ncbi:MAG: hypothetical protein V3R86_02290 [Candidatus Hydrothermarchaeaceae archaeon]
MAILVAALFSGCVSQTPPPQKTALALPTEAIKLSEVIPGMGEHWANPGNLPFGPVYLVYNGKVIGLEYMMHEDELKANPITLPSGEVVGKPVTMQTLDQDIDHADLAYMPAGHEGDEAPHYDVHMYFISQEEQSKIK